MPKESILAYNIKRYRKKLNISQDKLSKLSNVTYNTIIKIESGRNDNPTMKTITKIASALGVSIDDLAK
ncbi:MAG: helix-turn-helix transcriptional regulator [Candidatus Omnitrophica bacterium]|nr:helix-turn-helix transcriptional regulator [Candidatus Omnitrophota bacterium]MBU1852741.1 helix-turn-helix transcriptional regulator [Candidatus Omnitrophota bacterium]